MHAKWKSRGIDVWSNWCLLVKHCSSNFNFILFLGVKLWMCLACTNDPYVHVVALNMDTHSVNMDTHLGIDVWSYWNLECLLVKHWSSNFILFYFWGKIVNVFRCTNDPYVHVVALNMDSHSGNMDTHSGIDVLSYWNLIEANDVCWRNIVHQTLFLFYFWG